MTESVTNGSSAAWKGLAAASGFSFSPGFKAPFPRLELQGEWQGQAALEPAMGQDGRYCGPALVLKTGADLPGPVAEKLVALVQAMEAQNTLPDWPAVLYDSGAEGWLTLRPQQEGVVYLALPSPCIARCNFCSKSLPDFVQATRKHWDPGKDQVAHLRFWLKHGAISPGSQIILGGNEPLTFAGLEELMAVFLEAGHRPEVLSSTGWPLDSGRETRLADLGLKKVEMPLYGSRAEIQDSVQRYSGAMDRTLDAIRRFQAAGVSVALHTLLIKQTVEDFPALLRLIQELRPSQWTVRLPHGLKDAPWLGWDLLAPLAQVRHQLADCSLPEGVSTRLLLPPCVLPGKIPAQSEETTRTMGPDLLPPDFSPVCQDCSARQACPGLPGGYLSVFSDKDLQPLR